MAANNISNHALKRAIEREVLSQNIKLNKKQVQKNKKKALNIINKDLNEYFASAISYDKRYMYKYTELSNNRTCKKLVLDLSTNNLVTLINNVNFDQEITKYNIKLKSQKARVNSELPLECIYESYNGKHFVFVINSNNNIMAFSLTQANKKVISC